MNVEPDLRRDVLQPDAAERIRGRRRLLRGRLGRTSRRGDHVPAVLEHELERAREARRRAAVRGCRAVALVRDGLDRPAEPRHDRRGLLTLRGLEADAHPLDAVVRNDDRPPGRAVDLPPQRREPRAVGPGGRTRAVAAAQRLRLVLEIGDGVLRDPLGRSLVDRRDPLRGLDRDLDELARRGRQHLRLRARARRVPCDDQETDEDDGAGQRRGTDGAACAAHGEPAVPAPPAGGLGEQHQHRPRRADDRQRGEDSHLGAELGRLRREQQRREQADRDGVDPAPDLAGRDRLRVGDHEEEEDEDLGRERENAPEVPVRDRPEVPARGHVVPARREHGDARDEGDPERDGDVQQPQPPQDREAAADDDREREREPGPHRPPPELERVGVLRAEQQEAEHEPEVRGVEDVTASELDQVLREQRDGCRGGEDPPAVHAPPVAVLRPGHAEDEGDAVSGQERARRPEDHVLAPERDPHLEHRARQQRDEDLRDREPELERHLPQDLERDDHGRQVEARVADVRQQHRIRRASNRQGRLARAGSVHALMVRRDRSRPPDANVPGAPARDVVLWPTR